MSDQSLKAAVRREILRIRNLYILKVDDKAIDGIADQLLAAHDNYGKIEAKGVKVKGDFSCGSCGHSTLCALACNVSDCVEKKQSCTLLCLQEADTFTKSHDLVGGRLRSNC